MQLCSPFDAPVDFERTKIDRLGEKRIRAALQCLALNVGVPISDDQEERLFGEMYSSLAMGWEAVAVTGADIGHLMSILRMVGRTY